MLNCARDTRRNVDLRCNPGTGLADLVGVGTPTIVGDRTRAADTPVQQGGEFFQRGEAVGRADAACRAAAESAAADAFAAAAANEARIADQMSAEAESVLPAGKI